MSEMSVREAKVALRAAMRKRRAEIPAAARAGAALAMIGHVDMVLAALASSAVVAGFMPIGDELSPLPLMQALHARGHRLALPVMAGKAEPLLFRSYAPGDALSTVVWGIREPLPQSAVVEPDVVMTALLAFDDQGYRLGYGGGYYDRTIQALRTVKPSVRIVGLAFDQQRVDAVPVTDYDERVDWILTPSGARRAAT